MDSLWLDLRFALRSFFKNPAFSLTVVLTAALGIGAATAVFSVVDRILFRDLPYADAAKLVTFGFVAPIEPNEFILGADYLEWRARTSPFQSVTSFGGIQDCDLMENPPARLGCARVEASFLTTLGVQPLLGRNFARDEDRPGATPVVILSHALWKSRYGADVAMVGKRIPLDGKLSTVVGVLPADFELPTLVAADLMVPQSLDEGALTRASNAPQVVLRAFARLKAGVTIGQAKAALEGSFRESLKWVPPAFRREVSLSVRSVRERQNQESRLASWVLLAAVFAVLLIACANVANLLLARASGRRHEIAVRAALGAGRGRLARQMLTESIILALCGGALGCLLAVLLLSIFTGLSPEGIPRLRQASLDSRVLLFALAVSFSSGVIFGMASTRQEKPADVLRDRSTNGITPGTIRRLLVSAQVAISFVLLSGAGLLVRSLINLERAPLGMNAVGVIVAGVTLNPHLYSDRARQMRFFESLEQDVQRLPGVAAFALSDSLPPAGRSQASIYSRMQVAGSPRTPQGTGGMVDWRSVTPGYFSVLGIPIVRGRAFVEGDRDLDVSVVILSKSLAQRLFRNEDPLGKSIRFVDDGPWHTVIGIAGDVKNAGLTQSPAPEYYLARKHSPESAFPYSSLVMRTSLSPAAVTSWLRSTISALDPTVPVTIDTFDQRIARLEARPRFDTALLTTFGVFGVLLAAIGTYGVLGFFVAQRTREIGIRMALGAKPANIARITLGEGAKAVLIGMVVGLGVAHAATRYMASLLFDVSAADPLVFAAVAILFVLVASLASYLPARRAMRVDPMAALREV